MGARELMTEIAACGLSVRMDGGQLLVSPRELLTAGLRAAIKESKPELLAFLQGDAARPISQIDRPSAATVQHADDFERASKLRFQSGSSGVSLIGMGEESSRGQQQDERPEPPPDFVGHGAELNGSASIAHARDEVEPAPTRDPVDLLPVGLRKPARIALRLLWGSPEAGGMVNWLRTREAECDDRRLCVECGNFRERGTSCQHPSPVAIQAPRDLGRLAATPQNCAGFRKHEGAYAQH